MRVRSPYARHAPVQEKPHSPALAGGLGMHIHEHNAHLIVCEQAVHGGEGLFVFTSME
jgi:hypothetical protein